MTERVPAEVFAPGEFLREELDARGWTQGDLAEILGRHPRDISEIITGKRAITPETARGLEQALGTSAMFWLNLDSAYQLSRTKPTGNLVARRARLYERAPIKEMLRRHWIEPSESIDVLEKQTLAFFQIGSLDETPEFKIAARMSASYDEFTPAQFAWLSRARHLAGSVHARAFSVARLNEALQRLRAIVPNPPDIRLVPRVLADAGIRLIVMEHLPQTRIDGACFWLPRCSPVIALSLRYDRIDSFWYTLMHELGHVRRQDGLDLKYRPLDTDLVGNDATATEQKPAIEQEADRFAAETLVPQKELENFILRTRPLYSARKIEGFATRIGTHPGIVVGQLQFRKELLYSQLRRHLVKVREIVAGATLTDGWGFTAPERLPA
ncbi:MAG: HigA family addiction module antidote protein [Phycisphaerae bacterium]|nr:HigA family addiction module antidote protein [Phycisphaerae bacterium]